MNDAKAKATMALGMLCLAGCSMSTGIMPAGPNTYAVTERLSVSQGGSMAAQPKALAEATEHCRAQGREMMLVRGDILPGLENARVSTGYALTFRCLPPGDRELQR